jgi:hypothetical protein
VGWKDFAGKRYKRKKQKALEIWILADGEATATLIIMPAPGYIKKIMEKIVGPQEERFYAEFLEEMEIDAEKVEAIFFARVVEI